MPGTLSLRKLHVREFWTLALSQSVLMSRPSSLALAGSDTIERLSLTRYRPTIWMGVTILLFILVRIGKVEANELIRSRTSTLSIFGHLSILTMATPVLTVLCNSFLPKHNRSGFSRGSDCRPRRVQWP